MCGIIGGYKDITEGVESLIHRGPDFQNIIKLGKLQFGHTRLAIIDINPRSNQPFIYKDTTLIFNGEIWNYKSIKSELELLGDTFSTKSDTEVLAAALNRWGVATLNKLNGMFAIAWAKNDTEFYLARDKYGEIPLHISKQVPVCFASELKALLALKCNPKSFSDILPGHYAVITQTKIKQIPYYSISVKPTSTIRSEASNKIYNLLEQGVKERSISDVPICTLLSGGIDSAAITYFLSKIFNNLTSYIAVYNKKSRDLYNARVLAEHLSIKLIEVVVDPPTIEDLSKIIKIIEMPYKAQIEIGYPCLQLAKRINSDGFKVLFSGEGSDELWASYGFAYHGLKKTEWHLYRKNLFLSQARKNFIRCNKIFMAYSIECRLPFLTPSLVDYVIPLTKNVVQDGKNKPKAVLQYAFEGLLPETIVKRPKLAFQDGMGIKNYIKNLLPNTKRFYNAEFKRYYR